MGDGASADDDNATSSWEECQENRLYCFSFLAGLSTFSIFSLTGAKLSWPVRHKWCTSEMHSNLLETDCLARGRAATICMMIKYSKHAEGHTWLLLCMASSLHTKHADQKFGSLPCRSILIFLVFASWLGRSCTFPKYRIVSSMGHGQLGQYKAIRYHALMDVLALKHWSSSWGEL